AGFTKYTAAGGTDELKEAICEKLRKENGLVYDKSEVVISCGAKHVLYNIFQVLLDEGDEVLLPVPYWVSYVEQIKLGGGKPVFVETDDEFEIIPEKINEKISSKTKILLINSPNNPSGAVYLEKQLHAIADIAVDKNILVISDEVYEKFVYPTAKHFSIAAFNQGIKDLTLTVNAHSKTYAMTGWRIGYAGGPKEIIKAIADLQSHSTSNPASIAQKAALEALKGGQESVETMRTEFEKRRDFVLKRLEEMRIPCNRPDGAFYVFPHISKFFSYSIKSSMDFTNFLLEKARVAVVPGNDFGVDSNIRISYAASMKNLEEGMRRIENACSLLQ
ncbi:pyridoxal phosphate-dependent aminotransferase, partial [Candidatus Micrarchaeota archaeon]|nr:pyridoxal phosphate-dependent aminotransferase [Candidatus Micrarchaeota archaeon]